MPYIYSKWKRQASASSRCAVKPVQGDEQCNGVTVKLLIFAFLALYPKVALADNSVPHVLAAGYAPHVFRRTGP